MLRYLKVCANREDVDKSVHPRRATRVSTVYLNKL